MTVKQISYCLESFARPLRRNHKYDAGFDLACTRSLVSFSNRMQDGRAFIVDTGVKVLIPKGYYGLLVPRSSMTLDPNFHLETGVIDAEYTGTIRLVIKTLDPTGAEMHNFLKLYEDKYIAQLIINKLPNVDFKQVDALPSLPKNSRGLRSFGSSLDEERL